MQQLNCKRAWRKPKIPFKRLNEIIKRKKENIEKWKTECMILKKDFKTADKSIKSLSKWNEMSANLKKVLKKIINKFRNRN